MEKNCKRSGENGCDCCCGCCCCMSKNCIFHGGSGVRALRSSGLLSTPIFWSAIHNPNQKIILECNPFFNQSFFWNADCCTPTSTPLQLLDWSAEWSNALHFCIAILGKLHSYVQIYMDTREFLQKLCF